MSTLRKKKIFSAAPVKLFFIYGTNNSDSVVVGKARFSEIKDHSLITTPFQKRFSVKVLGMCLPYVKRYFQEHQWSVFFFMTQITYLLVLGVFSNILNMANIFFRMSNWKQCAKKILERSWHKLWSSISAQFFRDSIADKHSTTCTDKGICNGLMRWVVVDI